MREVNGPKKESAKDLEKVSKLQARMMAGAFERCASCLDWIDRKRAHVVALFVPFDGSESIAYVVCKRCWRDSEKSEEANKAFVERVETYLSPDEPVEAGTELNSATYGMTIFWEVNDAMYSDKGGCPVPETRHEG